MQTNLRDFDGKRYDKVPLALLGNEQFARNVQYNVRKIQYGYQLHGHEVVGLFLHGVHADNAAFHGNFRAKQLVSRRVDKGHAPHVVVALAILPTTREGQFVVCRNRRTLGQLQFEGFGVAAVHGKLVPLQFDSLAVDANFVDDKLADGTAEIQRIETFRSGHVGTLVKVDHVVVVVRLGEDETEHHRQYQYAEKPYFFV